MNNTSLHDYIEKEVKWLDQDSEDYEEAIYYAIYEWVKANDIKQEKDLSEESKRTLDFYGYFLEDFMED